MSWLERLLRRERMEEQLDKELSFHLEQYAADLVARGVEPVEAMRQARLSLGGEEQVKEDCRDARGTRWLEDFFQDLRYALRMLRQKPGFAAVALCTLALGIGATTVMFTVINSVLLKPLPYPEPHRLVGLQEKTEKATRFGNLWAFAYPNYLDCERESRTLQLAAWRFTGGTLSGPGDAEYANGYEITSGLFRVLGVGLARGRAFRPEEDKSGGTPVAILSYGFWQKHFSGSEAAVGSPVIFDGKPYTVVGIAPADFRLSDDEPGLFTPMGQDPSPRMQNRAAHPGTQVVARLLPGATLAQARTEIAVLARRLAEQFPKSNEGRTFLVDPLRPDVSDVRSTLWLLLGAVSLVLLIACANIASLLLARAVSRGRELAMRVALGAGRGRLARQCLTESAVLGVCGGVLGIGLAIVGVRPFVAFWPGALPRAEEVHPDWRVLLFALSVSLLSGLLFGLAPALHLPSRNLEQTLRAGSRSVAGGSRRLHGAFVIAEISLAVVLLVSAGMLGSTMVQLSRLNLGVNVQNVLTARMALPAGTLADPGRIRAAWADILERARRVPGVKAAAIVDTVPMRAGNNQVGYWTTPVEPPPNEQPTALATSVTPDYLKVTGMVLREGRFFDDRDRMGSESVVVMDEVMAREAYGGSSAVGQHVWIGLGADPARVVGVVDHVRHWGPAGDDQAHVRAQVYYPFAQVPDTLQRRWSELMSIVVRTGTEPLSLVGPLRHELRGASNDQVLYEVRTLEQIAVATLARQNFLMLLFGIFAGLALTLACIGLYGVLAYLTNQRVPEIGVRIALGATSGEVMRMVLRQSLGLIVAGVIVGTTAALAAGGVLRRLVEGMRPADPVTFVGMIAVLVAAALFASFLPARRASRVDPIKALRQE